ncbi:MAG TPA: hypothetical protein VFQ79_02130 [Bryobacteraceae bacterium]|nr:hypothetical protein [Bryobacteraceae bacterium]
MKPRPGVVCSLLVICANAGFAQGPEDRRWRFSSQAVFKNQHVWRGFVESREPTTIAEVTFAYGGLEMNLENVIRPIWEFSG